MDEPPDSAEARDGRPGPLSALQVAILRHVADCHSAGRLAAVVGLSVDELAQQLSLIRDRLGVGSTAAALRAAVDAGLLEEE